MRVSVIAIVLCGWMSVAAQSDSFEKQAMAMLHQMPVSKLDAKMPNRPFVAWFDDLIGQGAGVVWQLAECGAPIPGPGGAGQDFPACAEATVILPNGRRVIVAISVGTFKKGIVGAPTFFRAVIESDEQLYQVRRLRDLPEMLRAPRNLSPVLPDVLANLPQANLHPYTANSSPPTLGLNFAPGSIEKEDGRPPAPAPPTPITITPKPEQPRKAREGLVEGAVITRRKPLYPVSAKSMNAYGKVEVKIVVSETGRVIAATAISGPVSLRSAAVDAARQWVYQPTTLNGAPIKVENILTFIFTPGAR